MSSSPCGALQRRKTQQRGQQHIWICFFLYEQRLFWGSLAAPCTVLSVCLGPSTFLQGRGSPQLLLAGRTEAIFVVTDGLQPLATGTRATGLAGACCFWARNQWFNPPGHQSRQIFLDKEGIQFGADLKLVVQGAC